MVPAVPSALADVTWPATWPTDGRDGGVPDPAMVGPAMIQIGTEGGFLLAPVILPNTPIGYDYKPDFTDYGLGCFLLAGSEIVRLTRG